MKQKKEPDKLSLLQPLCHLWLKPADRHKSIEESEENYTQHIVSSFFVWARREKLAFGKYHKGSWWSWCGWTNTLKVRFTGRWEKRSKGGGVFENPVRCHKKKKKKKSHWDTKRKMKEKKVSAAGTAGGGRWKWKRGGDKERERESFPGDEIHLHKNPILLPCNMLQMDGLT